MNDVMIDIETLGATYDSVILTVGAIKFSRTKSGSNDTADKFYQRIGMKSCIDAGLITNKQTVEWWKRQSHAAQQEALYNPDRVPLKVGLIALAEWLGDITYFWANGSDFDYGILGHAYRVCGLDIPWKFYNIRDARTVYDIAGVRLFDEPSTKLVAHNALDDCDKQIRCLHRAFNQLCSVK